MWARMLMQLHFLSLAEGLRNSCFVERIVDVFSVVSSILLDYWAASSLLFVPFWTALLWHVELIYSKHALSISLFGRLRAHVSWYAAPACLALQAHD